MSAPAERLRVLVVRRLGECDLQGVAGVTPCRRIHLVPALIRRVRGLDQGMPAARAFTLAELREGEHPAPLVLIPFRLNACD